MSCSSAVIGAAIEVHGNWAGFPESVYKKMLCALSWSCGGYHFLRNYDINVHYKGSTV